MSHLNTIIYCLIQATSKKYKDIITEENAQKVQKFLDSIQQKLVSSADIQRQLEAPGVVLSRCLDRGFDESLQKEFVGELENIQSILS